MTSISITTKVNVSQCFQCPGATEYHCRTCGQNLCPQCKKTHTLSLDTKHHCVVVYKNKHNTVPKAENCAHHTHGVYEMFCELCHLPVCFWCRKHRKHKLLNIKSACENKQNLYNRNFLDIRSEILYNAQVLLATIQSEFTICHTNLLRHQPEMLTSSEQLKRSMDNVSTEVIVKCRDILIRNLCNQIMKIKIHLTKIQRYEQTHEKSACRPIHFLRLIKEHCFLQIQDTPHLTQHCVLSLSPDINMRDLMQLLTKFQITKNGKRKAGNRLLLKLMPSALLQKSLTLKDVDDCLHISCVSTDRVWVSDGNNFVLTNTTSGDTLYTVDDSISYSWRGLHTVNNKLEVLYINKDYHVNRISNELKATTFLYRTDVEWRPRCLHSAPTTGDLLVAMWNNDRNIGKVNRYNKTGLFVQTIRNNSRDNILYRNPSYITENGNGDVVVSDIGLDSLVVTDRDGGHRFSYSGPPSGVKLLPWGICTDALSHILVCDDNTHTVQMISKDGEFLSYLLTEQSPGIQGTPRSLSYDVNSHILWVGSLYNTLSMYRYINRNSTFID